MGTIMRWATNYLRIMDDSLVWKKESRGGKTIPKRKPPIGSRLNFLSGASIPALSTILSREGREKKAAARSLRHYKLLIHVAMSLSTSGATVSSILEASIGLPVALCWNRWLNPG